MPSSTALRYFSVLLLALLGLPPHVRAQTVPIPSASPWMIDASTGWKVHSGDDPAYARTNFDDSGWTAVRLPATNMKGNRRWYRARMAVPPGTGAVDLLLVVPAAEDEVYVDGARVSPPIRSSWLWRAPVITGYPLPPFAGKHSGSVEVAVRSHAYAQEFASPVDFESAGLASPSGTALAVFAARALSLSQYGTGIWIMGLTATLGLFLLGLFLVQRTQREYLWLALTLLFQGSSGGLVLLAFRSIIPLSINAFWGDPCSYFLLAAELEFVHVFAHKRPGRAIRVGQAVLVATPFVLNPLEWFAVVPFGTLLIVESSMTLLTILMLAWVLIAWTRHGSREAAVLLVPILLATAGTVLVDLFDIPGVVPISLARYRFALLVIGQALFLVSIAIVLVYRFPQVSRREANAAAELEAARALQQILIPEVLPSVAGYSIDSVYHPAQQVGGDFFQIIPAPGDAASALVILGDVSGKGMPAAMTVSVLVGAIRTLAEYTRSPAELLAGLNRRLLGRGPGFATCLVLHVSPGGRVIAANAGHLNPYLGGKELVVDPGLPLDLAVEARYTEVSFTLLPGQTLTLLTDGVPEATDPSTRALLGFERTAQLSTGTAASIASAATTFGAPAAPSDDITVLTLALA